MANVLLGITNNLDNPSTSFSGSFGSWLSTLPLLNLKSHILSKVARSSNATLSATQFGINIGAVQNIRVVALCNHNLQSSALVRITSYSDSGYASQTSDSGWLPVWTDAYSAGWGGWNDTTPGGTLPHGYLFSNPTNICSDDYFINNFVYLPSAKIEARYWKVEINDTTNSNGYVQIGRIFFGNGWEPDFNFEFNQSIGWETQTNIQYSKGGTPYFDAKFPVRVAKFTLADLSQIEAMQTVFGINGYHGIDKEIFYVQDRSAIYDYQRSNFLGRLRQLSPIEHATVSQYSAAFEIVESL